MAITLDTIVNKVFKVVKNGYDNNEVESFLDEILEEMENREAETNKLKEQVAQLTAELNQARADLQAAKSAQPAVVTAAPTARPAQDDRHSSESFELVLSKAKGAYEEIVSAADTRAAEIINKANQDAATIRSDAQSKIADLTSQLTALRKQTSEYYDSLKKISRGKPCFFVLSVSSPVWALMKAPQRLFCRDAGYRSVFRADGIARRSFVMLKGKERCVALSDIEDSLNRISAQLTQIEKSLPPRYAWKRRFVLDLASGFSIGFTVLGALLLYVLQHIALANLPIIGKFLAELVRIVESNL